MANVLRGPVMIADSAGIIATSSFPVAGFVWGNVGTSGDDLHVIDKSGNTILSVKGIANQPVVVMFPKHISFQGLIVKTIDSGLLHIYS